MKRKEKNLIITLLIIAAVLILAFFVLTKKHPSTDTETAKCIGKNSVLYTRLGCSHCKVQEDMFGENLQYLTITDCFYDNQPCIDNNITGTPTWIIKGNPYIGVQSIDKLKGLTGC